MCLRYLTTEVGSDRGYYRIDAATGRVDPARTKNLSEAATFRGLGPHGCRSRDVSALLVRKAYGLPDKMGKSQANEGMWGMPGHIEAMKAAVSCDKLGGAAHTR